MRLVLAAAGIARMIHNATLHSHRFMPLAFPQIRNDEHSSRSTATLGWVRFANPLRQERPCYANICQTIELPALNPRQAAPSRRNLPPWERVLLPACFPRDARFGPTHSKFPLRSRDPLLLKDRLRSVYGRLARRTQDC